MKQKMKIDSLEKSKTQFELEKERYEGEIQMHKSRISQFEEDLKLKL